MLQPRGTERCREDNMRKEKSSKGMSFPTAKLPENAMKQTNNGSMNYMSVQEKMDSKDKAKLSRNSYKDNRYKGE